MSQPINITTLAGVRLDVTPSATIELNMGGMSLLSLSDRTATYTNSFSLPRTPINESVFEFASQPTRNNRPSVNVIISKGLFQRKAVLRVLEFNNDYKCSLSFSTFTDVVKNDTIANIFETSLEIPTTATTIQNAVNSYVNGSDVSYLHTIYTGTLKLDINGIWLSMTKFLELLAVKYGYTHTEIGDFDFDNDFILLRERTLSLTYNTPYPGTFLFSSNIGGAADSEIKLNEVLKSVCKTYPAFFTIDEETKVINFKTLKSQIENEAIFIEDFSDYTKKIYSGYGGVNYIKYDVDDSVEKTFASDSFISDGEAIKDVVNIGAYVPKSTGGIYDVTGINKIIIARRSVSRTNRNFLVNWTQNSTPFSQTITASVPNMSIIDLSGSYSDILTPIFTNPIILEATKWFDTFTANQIMESRIINSVQLGGKYWVDSMAYDLTTGQSKLTLIKLQ